MFSFDKYRFSSSTLFEIVGNYHLLVADDNPMIYHGTNKYGASILGVVIEDDDDANVLYYFHLLLTTKQLYEYLERRTTLYRILHDKQTTIAVVMKDYLEGILEISPISISDIPEDYLPFENSLCPRYTIQPSLSFAMSLHGNEADSHKVDTYEVNEVEKNFNEGLHSAMAPLKKMGVIYKLYQQPAMAGSFRTNFSIELNIESDNLFPINSGVVSEYVTKYLSFILRELPTAEEEELEQKYESHSAHVQEVKSLIANVYSAAESDRNYLPSDEVISQSIANTARIFESVSEAVRNSHSFSSLEIVSVPKENSENKIGLIDEEFHERLLASKMIYTLADFDMAISATVEPDDTEPKEYRIRVIQFNTETGNGRADLYFGDSEDAARIILHVRKFHGSLDHTQYTYSMDDKKVITVKGMLSRSSSTTTLTIDHESIL